MPDRRKFLIQTVAGVGTLWTDAFTTRLRAEISSQVQGKSAEQIARDEGFWAGVRHAFALNDQIINLDNGWTNPSPRQAVDQLVRGARALEALPAEELDRLFFQFKRVLTIGVAQTLGVDASEIAIVRNATEALNTVLLGLRLNAGDEIVCSSHDYFAMLDALEQRQARDHVRLHMLRPPVPAPTLEALATMYEAAIGPRTKLVLLTHPSNLTGQLLPVRRIAEAAHRVGAEVVVDGAQSCGVIDDPITSLACDYYGASAHKWLGAPVGVGVLWMRPGNVQKVWPQVPPPAEAKGMARFQWIGTAPAYIEPAALQAIKFHDTLGAARKAARLRYLTAYWRKRAATALPDARFYTTGAPDASIGLCTIEVPGVDANALQRRLRNPHRILVQSMADNARAPEIRGIRVTPNVFTTLADLDRFVTALAAEVQAARRRSSA